MPITGSCAQALLPKHVSLEHDWNDDEWMQKRRKKNDLNAPWSVYEVHLASWMRPYPNNEGFIKFLSRNDRTAGSLCKGNGIYACRIYAGDGISF